MDFKVIKAVVKNTRKRISSKVIKDIIIYEDDRFKAVINDKTYLINNYNIEPNDYRNFKDNTIRLYSHPNNDFYKELYSTSMPVDNLLTKSAKHVIIINNNWSKWYIGQRIKTYEIINEDFVKLIKVK